MNSKGQSQIVTAVLLTGIMVVLVSSVYLWGVPLIQKQRDTVNLNNMETFMKDLDEKIQRVATNGGRERIDSVRIPGEMRIIDNDLDDRIELDFETTGQLTSTGIDIYLVGNNETVVPISRPSGSLKVFSERIDEKTYDMTMTLFYREVTSTLQSHKINLDIGGRSVIGQGNHDIIITESGSRQLAGAGDGGRDLFVTDVTIRLE